MPQRYLNYPATYLQLDISAYEPEINKAHAEAKDLPISARPSSLICDEGSIYKSNLGVESGDKNAIGWYWDQGESDILRGIACG